MMKSSPFKRVAAALTALAFAIPAAISTPAQAANEIKIGVITSTSGPLASYGSAFVDAFEWGLNYYTGGKMSVNGVKLSVVKKDDGADPTAATAAFKSMVSDGVKIITGTASSGVALTLAPLAEQNKVLYISGPAKVDAITSSKTKHVFRSGNTSFQDFAPLGGIKPIKGKKVILFVEDNAFGLGNIAAAKLTLAPKGANFVEIKVPTSATDFTPYAKRAADEKADYIFIAWSNAGTSGLLFKTLAQQGTYAKAIPITGLAGVAAYDAYGTFFEGVPAILSSSYFPGASKTKAYTDLAASFKKANKSQDLFTPTGADAAKMVVLALTNNTGQDVSKMINNLEGAQWVGVKGLMKIRATDHVLIQPMYIAKLVKEGGKYNPVLTKTIASVTTPAS